MGLQFLLNKGLQVAEGLKALHSLLVDMEERTPPRHDAEGVAAQARLTRRAPSACLLVI